MTNYKIGVTSRFNHIFQLQWVRQNNLNFNETLYLKKQIYRNLIIVEDKTKFYFSWLFYCRKLVNDVIEI